MDQIEHIVFATMALAFAAFAATLDMDGLCAIDLGCAAGWLYTMPAVDE